MSLSARRAWIEMLNEVILCSLMVLSLSARRAWIEMGNYCERSGMLKGRSPQGERG